MRNALATVPKVARQMVAATLRTVFAQPDQASAQKTIERICRLFEKRYPRLVKIVQEAEVDVLAFYSFPVPIAFTVYRMDSRSWPVRHHAKN